MKRRDFLRRSAFALALLLPWKRDGEAAVVEWGGEVKTLSLGAVDKILRDVYGPSVLKAMGQSYTYEFSP